MTRAPLRDLALDPRGELGRRAAEDVEAEVAEALRTSAAARMRSVSAIRRSMMAGEVPAGAIKPNQGTASKPGKPASIIVGSSGAIPERFTDVTATLSLRFFTRGTR